MSLKGKKLKFATLLSNPENAHKAVEDICFELNISSATYYRYLRDPEVIAEMNAQIKEFADAYKRKAWQNLMECCDEHSVPAIKLYFDMMGENTGAQDGTVINVKLVNSEE